MALRKQEAAVPESAVALAFVDVVDKGQAQSVVGGSHSLRHFHSAVLLTVLLVTTVVSKFGNVPVEEDHDENVHWSDVLGC